MRTYHEDGENCMMEDISIQRKVQANAERIIKTGIAKSAHLQGFFFRENARENDITR